MEVWIGKIRKKIIEVFFKSFYFEAFTPISSFGFLLLKGFYNKFLLLKSSTIGSYC